MPSEMQPGFDKPYAAFLFDMDGTILNSTAAAERVWSEWAARQGLDVEAFMPTMHGSRAIDTITRLNLPGVDPAYEAALITRLEIDDVEGVVAIPGAAAFLASLPSDRWAIVTSSPRELALRRLQAAGLPVPATLVTAEDVKIGKPDPFGYKLGAERLGVNPSDCLVFEDVMAGILAGEAAGADVMVITSTHRHALDTRHAVLQDYTAVKATRDSAGMLLISQTVNAA